MAQAFILMFYLWTPSQHAGAAVTFAEFSTEARCQAAGEAAKHEFAGMLSVAYYLCVPK